MVKILFEKEQSFMNKKCQFGMCLPIVSKWAGMMSEVEVELMQNCQQGKRPNR